MATPSKVEEGTPIAVAIPWYQSKSLLTGLATMIILILSYFGLLPEDLTQEKLVGYLIIGVPLLVSLVTRFRSTSVLTSSKAKAEDLNVAADAAFNDPNVVR